MRQSSPRLRDVRSSRGVTLIELMIGVAIVAIIASLAYPSYRDSVRKSRRSEAVAALAALQQAQERIRSSNPTYTTDLTVLKVASTTPSNYYTIAVPSADATGYTATATPVAGSTQATDSKCTLFVVRIDKGNIIYGSNTSTDTADANRCWAK